MATSYGTFLEYLYICLYKYICIYIFQLIFKKLLYIVYRNIIYLYTYIYRYIFHLTVTTSKLSSESLQRTLEHVEGRRDLK